MFYYRILIIVYFFKKLFKMDLEQNSINDVITDINQIADVYKSIHPELMLQDDPFEVEILSKSLNRLYKPKNLAPKISELIALCLYYEDLYHNKKEAFDKLLIQQASNKLAQKVSHFVNYTNNLSIKAKEINTPERFNEEVLILRHKLEELERTIEITN